MNHGDHREHGELLHAELSEQVIASAIEVHRELGPGLLESAYEACLIHELHARGLQVKRQVPVPIRYKGVELEPGFRIDLLVEDRILVELKAVDALSPIHDAQVLTYLKLAGIRVGLLLNFNSTSLRRGMRRLVR